jgi:asparagine synthase (glutamine-hydrolysing)
MCGLTGFIDFSNSTSEDTLKRMTDSLIHRGPDDSGTEVRTQSGASIGFGFRRLSIIDLSPAGHQPMINEINGDMIVFNGEVYNFTEIREQLEELGHRFNSKSDTEVVLKSFQQWGVTCVERFIGMFAIVLFSPATGKVHFFRDRAGVKPLYYYWDGKLFMFASELKAFHQHPGFKKQIDFSSLRLYFHHGYVPSPYSIFRYTFKLEPGQRMEFDLKTKHLKKQIYWDLMRVFNKPKLKIDFHEAIEEMERILTSAFQYRMVSDVPVGVFLSGGYDSTCVTALLQEHSSVKLKTFTISFDNEIFNEGHYAQTVSDHLDTEHYNYHCTEEDAMQLVSIFPQVYDEPLSDGGGLPNILVSQKASEHVKVVLSADGGDEIFAGYSKHHYSRQQYHRYFGLPYPLRYSMAKAIGIVNLFRKWPIYRVDRISRLQSFLEAKDASTLFGRVNQTFTDFEINQFLKPRTKRLYNKFMNDHLLDTSNDEIDRIIAIDFQTFLSEDILPKVDRATSFASIEGREPLLDQRIIEFAATLPSSFKLNDSKGKYILREIVHKYVPATIMDRPKMGFGIPISHWGQGKLKPVFDECFDKKFLEDQGIFSVSKIRELYESYQSGNMMSFDRMFTVFVFQQWYRKWMMIFTGYILGSKIGKKIFYGYHDFTALV